MFLTESLYFVVEKNAFERFLLLFTEKKEKKVVFLLIGCFKDKSKDILENTAGFESPFCLSDRHH